jgi:hypothetical protein
MYVFLLHLPPPYSNVSEDAGLEPWTVATLELAVNALATPLDLIYKARSHLQGFISSTNYSLYQFFSHQNVIYTGSS